ncbi:hypothetical protein GE09DRAFT_1258469 [Coniochaeta sp. 2T2.1]|nr:hypothetical protein GE09DRAFT_1258469 [Coniochaeta sp. 2T2.1]
MGLSYPWQPRGRRDTPGPSPCQGFIRESRYVYYNRYDAQRVLTALQKASSVSTGRWDESIAEIFVVADAFVYLIPDIGIDEFWEIVTEIVSWTEEKVSPSKAKFYKRSVRPDEYRLGVGNKPYIPPLGFERLQNEAACLDYIRRKTNIPAPNTLEAYVDEGGSFVLVTKWLQGV